MFSPNRWKTNHVHVFIKAHFTAKAQVSQLLVSCWCCGREKRSDACLLQSALIGFQSNILHSVGQIDNFVGAWSSSRKVPGSFTEGPHLGNTHLRRWLFIIRFATVIVGLLIVPRKLLAHFLNDGILGDGGVTRPSQEKREGSYFLEIEPFLSGPSSVIIESARSKVSSVQFLQQRGILCSELNLSQNSKESVR